MPLSKFTSNQDGSKELCFDTNAFLKDSFSIDEFLRNHRNKATLEALRDDLGTYLKTLRLSMIELINKDYEDFVNLSKDLVGLNTGIEILRSPLQQIKSEVLVVKSNLEDTITGLRDCLDRDKDIKEKKSSLKHLTHVITSLAKLKILLQEDTAEVITPKFNNLDLIERVGNEYHMVLFSVLRCKPFLVKAQEEDVECVGKILMNLLGNTFLECLCEKQSSQLNRCLRVFASLDKVSDVEKLVREEVVAPFLHHTINETSLQKEPSGLRGIYEKVIEFSDMHLAELIDIGKTCARAVRFNFLVNSLWVELERRMEVHMASVFSVGDPDIFRVRYSETTAFLLALQQRCGSKSNEAAFLSHPQTLHFRQKWNLLVYYKIRFQEIAGQLEFTLNNVDLSTPAMEGSSYRLKTSAITLLCVQRCWDDRILISDLVHMFWKLSLQILSRHCVWIKEETGKDSATNSKSSADPLNPSAQSITTALRSRLNFLVCLSCDTNTLIDETKQVLVPIQQRVQSQKMAASMEEAFTQLTGCLALATNSIVAILVRESVIHLSHVSAIPRLFRRTNRESPTKPCDYVSHLLRLPTEFYLSHKDKVLEGVMEAWMIQVLSEICEKFYDSVSEVLTNAQRTEESLRRLKKAKERSSGVPEPKTGSDDDKIRHQLVIDVHRFCEDVDGVGVEREKVSKLSSLLTLVESARENAMK